MSKTITATTTGPTPRPTAGTLTDIDIVALAKEHLEDGFRMLVARYMKPIYWHIRRLVVNHEDAEDVTQETFIRIYRSIAQFKGGSKLSTWIYRIATNEALRFLGKQRDTLHIDEDEQDFFELKADEYVDYANIAGVRFQRAVLSLPTKQQLTFNLRYHDGLEYSEIAAITGSSEATAKVNYHIAKKKIIEYINS
jgi:RNA polymerase sigma-70 factor, ECF subfamily